MLAGDINEILWSADCKMVVAVGLAKNGALAACNPESGSRVGEILGFNGTALCGCLTSKKVLFIAGESNDILRYNFPYKGQGK